MKNSTKKTTRAAAALDRLMAGRQHQKINGQVTGRAAEQWDSLLNMGKAVGIGVDEILALLLHLGYNILLTELTGRPKASQATPAAKA